MRRALPLLLPLLLALTSLAACASAPPPQDKEAAAEAAENNDPLEPANRVFYAVNDGLDTVLLRPLAVTYRAVTPGPMRRSVNNVLSNLNNPVVFANDVMQGKPHQAGDTAMRLLANTTLGVGGLFDVAGGNGFPAHDNDFGLTLASWGAPSGPFLFLPVLGPSNPRDAAGFTTDIALDPITWPSNGGGFNAFRITRSVLDAVNTREKTLDVTTSIMKTSLDPYATYRSLYQQHRQSVINDMRQGDTTPDNPPDQPPAGVQPLH